jgi:hypothetical protein
MSDLDGAAEIFEQRSLRVTGRRNAQSPAVFGWSISPNIERASASREGRAIEKPVALIPAARLDDDESDNRLQEILVTSYNEALPHIRDRVGAVLKIRYEDFDSLCDFPTGLSGKVFGPAQVKRLGIEKFFDAIRGAGLRIRLEEDPEQTAKMLARIAENYNPRQANQARPFNHSHPSNKMIDVVLQYLANNKQGGLARLNDAVKEARSNWARNAAKASWEKKRATEQCQLQAEG